MGGIESAAWDGRQKAILIDATTITKQKWDEYPKTPLAYLSVITQKGKMNSPGRIRHRKNAETDFCRKWRKVRKNELLQEL